jgi:conjugative relaxase-like TrwC/TraI family protein
MATSLKKLKIGVGQLAGADVVGYLADPQDVGDYYTEEGTAPMNWLATERARTIFALHPDRVSTTTLRQLIEGLDPVTGQLIRRYGPDGTMVGGIDLTVSPAPKSVSVLWALGDNRLRYELEVMVGQAVDAAVKRMLKEQPLTRERQGDQVVPAIAEDYVAVQVMHTTARMSASSGGVPDPQLHVHNVLIGAVDDKDRLRAFDSLAIMRYRAELDAEASGYLAELLRQRGFEIVRRLERRRNGQPRVVWEVAGVPQSLIEAMSSRTAEIEDLRKKYEEMYGRQATGPAWEAWIAAQRAPKAKLSSAELRVEWTVEAERHGLDLAALDVLVAEADRRRAAGIAERDEHSPEAEELRRLILEHVNRDHAFVPLRELERLARQLAVGLVDPLVTTDVVIGDLVGDGDLLVTIDDQVTTLEVLRYEQRSRAAAAELLAAAPLSPVSRELVERELTRRAEEGRPFDERQAAAIRLAVSGARFVSITGPAGTGKGYATSAMTALWHRQGRRVLAVAVAGRTAQQAAADSGADEALNIDLLLTRLEHGRLGLSPGDVVLADEAGMIDHARYAPLLEAVARSGATLVQVGDDHQLSPVGPGGLWTTTHRMAEAAGRAVELDVVRRARDRREAKAWGDLRHGRIAEALAWMRDERRLVLYETRGELLAGMVEDWWQGNRDGLMVVDSSNAERDELNRLAQARRLEAGELGAEALRISSGRELRRGDRVLFSAIYRPEPEQGQRRVRRVENGTSAVVVDVDVRRRRAVLELHEGEQRRRLEVGADVPLELAYARHVAKAQGVTHEDTDLATSRTTRRNELYVMATRARAGARFHAVAAELREGDLAEGGDAPWAPEVTPMTDAQAAVLERHDVVPDPSWSWIQASLAIDFATGAPIGRQAGLWLQAMGYRPESAERIIEEALRPAAPEAPAPEEPPAPAIPPMTEAQRALLEDRGTEPDPSWSWVQASLAIDAATGAPTGRQATEWLVDQGYTAEAAARIVQEARAGASAAPIEVEAQPPPAPVEEARPAAPAVEAAPAATAGALPPGATPAADLLAQLEAQRERQEQATAYATIRAIHRQAERLSTKEAVGDRPMRAGAGWRTDRHNAAVSRGEGRSESNAERAATTSQKWEASYARDRVKAPSAAREAAQEATRGQVQRRPARTPERAPIPLPARSLAENVLGRREPREAMTSMGFYQATGRLEQAADPAGRAVELLADDPQAVVVAATPDLWRQVRERAEAAGVALEHEGQPRVLQGEAAYNARLQRREAWQAEQPRERRHLIEPGAIERAYVVTDDPWARTELTRAVSVANESHVVVPQLRPALAEEVNAEAVRMQAAMEARADRLRVDQAARAREAAMERAQAEVDRSAAREAERAATAAPTPAPIPTPEAERGGAER